VYLQCYLVVTWLVPCETASIFTHNLRKCMHIGGLLRWLPCFLLQVGWQLGWLTVGGVSWGGCRLLGCDLCFTLCAILCAERICTAGDGTEDDTRHQTTDWQLPVRFPWLHSSQSCAALQWIWTGETHLPFYLSLSFIFLIFFIKPFLIIIIMINRLFMVPHPVRALSTCKDIKICSFHHTHTHTLCKSMQNKNS